MIPVTFRIDIFLRYDKILDRIKKTNRMNLKYLFIPVPFPCTLRIVYFKLLLKKSFV